MSFVLQELETRRPFRGVGEAFGQGVTQGIEQSIIDQVLQQAQGQADGGQGDFMNNLLRGLTTSALPAPRQNELINAFQNQEQLQAAQAQAVAKAAGPDKIGEKFLEGEMDSVEQLGNFQLALQQAQEAVESGNVSPRLIGGNPISGLRGKIAPTEADQQLKSATKAFFGIGKNLFGANVAKEQSKLLQDMLPAPGKSLEENRAGIQVLKEVIDLKQLLTDIAQQDEAVIGGQVNARDVARIKGNQRTLMAQYFEGLRQRQSALEEARRRGLFDVQSRPKAPNENLTQFGQELEQGIGPNNGG